MDNAHCTGRLEINGTVVVAYRADDESFYAVEVYSTRTGKVFATKTFTAADNDGQPYARAKEEFVEQCVKHLRMMSSSEFHQAPEITHVG